MKKIILLIPILFLMTGCFNYREINELAIVSGISITKDGEDIKLTTEVVNPKKEQDASSGEEPEYVIYTGKARSVQEAFREMIRTAPRKMYVAQMEILIIDEEIAKKHLWEILDFFSRDPEVRSEFKVLVGKSDKILEITTPLEKVSSQNILDSLTANSKYLGYANLTTYHQFIDNLLNPYVELALPVVEMKGNAEEGQEKSNIEETKSDADSVINGMAVFKDNQLKGYLSKKESLAYNIIQGNANGFLIRKDYPDDEYIVNEVISSKSKMEFEKDHKIKIEVTGTAAISEVTHKVQLDDERTIQRLQKDMNREIEKLIRDSAMDITQKYNSDIFGFADLIYKTDPKFFKRIKKDWYETVFPNLEIEVTSKIKIVEQGNLNRGVYDE